MPYPKQEIKEWYEQSFVWNMTFSNSQQLNENEPRDWARVKIYNTETNRLEPALSQGHSGRPSEHDMERMYEAFKSGNLYLYTLGSDQPMRIVEGKRGDWMDLEKVDVDRYKSNLALLERGDEAPQPPKQEDFYQQISGIKLLLNRWFNWFEEDVRRYNDGRAAYDNAIQGYREENRFFAEQPQRRLAAAVLELAPQRAQERESELAEREFRVRSHHTRWVSWRLDHALEALDGIFGPRPQPVYPQVTTKLLEKGNAMKEETLRRLQDHGYDLPADSKLTQRQAATINLLLACNPEITEPTFRKITNDEAEVKNLSRGATNMVITGIFFEPRHSIYLDGVMAGFDAAKPAIEAYQNGDPTVLAQLIAGGVRNYNLIHNAYKDPDSPDKCGFGILAEQMLDLLEAHPDLKEASGLTQEELEELHSHVVVTRIGRNSLDAQLKLEQANAGKITLSAQEKAQCIADIGLNTMVYQCFDEDIRNWESSPESTELLAELMDKRNALNERLEQARASWQKLPMKEQTARQEAWIEKNGSPESFILLWDNARPMCPFQKKLGMPGVEEAIITGYRTLPTLEENVRELTPKQLLEIAGNPQKLGELMSASQEGNVFRMNPVPVNEVQLQADDGRRLQDNNQDLVNVM